MTDVNVKLADTEEALGEMQYQRDMLKEQVSELEQEKENLIEQAAQAEQQVQTLKLALQACNERIRLYDATLTGIRLTVEGFASATQGQR